MSELNELEALVLKLRGEEAGARNQTDLEIAILRKQVAKLTESKKEAAEKVDKALSILEVLG